MRQEIPKKYVCFCSHLPRRCVDSDPDRKAHVGSRLAARLAAEQVVALLNNIDDSRNITGLVKDAIIEYQVSFSMSYNIVGLVVNLLTAKNYKISWKRGYRGDDEPQKITRKSRQVESKSGYLAKRSDKSR